MYVLGICGSPRIGGNSEILIDRALKGVEDNGIKTEKIILNRLKIAPCQECEDVYDDGTCRIGDDFQIVYQRLMEADGIILASPIFFGSLSAQTKIMIDRFQCFWRYKYILKEVKSSTPRKAGSVILVEASGRTEFFENAKFIIKIFFDILNISYKDELFCTGIEGKGSVLKHPDILENAYDIGRNLL